MTVTAVRHESAAGRWELLSTPPHPALAGYVRGYTGYAERTVAAMRRREMVNGDHGGGRWAEIAAECG